MTDADGTSRNPFFVVQRDDDRRRCKRRPVFALHIDLPFPPIVLREILINRRRELRPVVLPIEQRNFLTYQFFFLKFADTNKPIL